MNSPQITIQIPSKLDFFLTEKARYKVAYGGRGSGKSHAAAKSALIKAQQKETRILCTREFQNSIADSVHKLFCDQIDHYKLPHFYITKTNITNLATGSEFIFKGLKKNINEIKSLEGIDICWIEEAARVSSESWDILVPTIRKEKSELWLTFNPELVDDATYQRFIVNPRPDSIVQKVNYYDNPFFPEVLKKEMEYNKKIQS